MGVRVGVGVGVGVSISDSSNFSVLSVCVVIGHSSAVVDVDAWEAGLGDERKVIIQILLCYTNILVINTYNKCIIFGN